MTLTRVKGPFYVVEARLTKDRPWKRITDDEVFKPHGDRQSAVREAKSLERVLMKKF